MGRMVLSMSFVSVGFQRLYNKFCGYLTSANRSVLKIYTLIARLIDRLGFSVPTNK